MKNFLNFKMVYEKSVMEQTDMFQNLVYDLRSKGVNIDDTLVVASLIKNLPPFWSNFRRMLNYGTHYSEFSEVLEGFSDSN